MTIHPNLFGRALKPVLWGLFFAIAAGTTPVLAVHEEGVFELDGNATDVAVPPGIDWSSFWNSPGLDEAFITDDVNTSTDNIFAGGGSKDERDISSSGITTNFWHADRTLLGDDIAHYRYDVAMGPGKYDVVRIHRIVREARPNKPVSTRDAVMLLHGNPGTFEGQFMTPMVTGVSEPDHSIAIFLAKNDIDVWGMDYGWALVPSDETDFTFMGQWGLGKDVAHAEAALSFVRSMRVATGQGNGKLQVLGLSYGGQVGYALVGEETVQPAGLRNAKGLIALDIGVKTSNESEVEFYCAMAEADQARLESNPPSSYANNIGLSLYVLGYLASSAPDDPSPYFTDPVQLTNWQAALFVGAETELLTPGQSWHLVGGYLDEYGIPSGLRFTDDQLWVGAMMASYSPYYPRRIDIDTDQLLCGTSSVPSDNHFAQITVPILHVGAKGGFGPSMYASTTLTASRDVTTITVQRLSDSDEAMDFGHVDTVLASEAETLVWRPILDWIMTHRENRP